MPIRPFKGDMPKNSVEWARYFQEAEVSLDPGSIGAEDLEDGSVTFQKLQHVTPNRLLGRDTSPAGVVQELEVTGGLEFTGTGVQRSALEGDITAAAGSATTTLRSATALSILGNPVNSTAALVDVPATVADTFLVRRGAALTFDALEDGDIPATIARDAEVTAAIAALSLASGTYTPTLTGVMNVDATTSHLCHYLRVGSTVQVSGHIEVDATAAAATQVRISLPISSNLGAVGDCAGCAYSNTVASGAAILADATNDTALMEYVATDTANRALWFSFSYRII
jgi:hypothetical protein